MFAHEEREERRLRIHGNRVALFHVSFVEDVPKESGRRMRQRRHLTGGSERIYVPDILVFGEMTI